MQSAFLRLCLENSTVHGISHAARGTSLLQRILWTLLFLTASGAFGYYFWQNWSKFNSQPTSVTMKMYGTRFVAPDIHVCNLFPFAKSRLAEAVSVRNSSEMQSLLEEFRKIENLTAKTGLSNEAKTYFLFSAVNQAKLFAAAGHLKNQTFLRLKFPSDREIPKTEIEVEHHIFYFSCFRISLVNESEFLSTSNQLGMVLYTDNYQNEASVLQFAKQSLSTEEYAFLPSIFQFGGILLIFTPPGGYPNVESHSILIKPGYQTIIKLKMQKTITENTVANPCVSSKETINYFNPLYGYRNTTTFQKSIATCKYRKVLENVMKKEPICQCIPFMVPTTMDMLEKYRICGNVSAATNDAEFSTALKQMACSGKFWSYSDQFNITDCYPEKPCESIEYSSDVSTIQWPNDGDIDKIASSVIQPLTTNIGDAPGVKEYLRLVQTNSSDKYFMTKSNLASVFVKTVQTNSMLVEETLSYGMENLISDTGGIAGLYLGASFLSIFELFDLLHYYVYVTIFQSKSHKASTLPV